MRSASVRTSLGLLCLAVGCGPSVEATDTPTAAPSADLTAGGEAYDLHEWGLVSTGPNGFELAAGPGQRAVSLVVDKPVLYVHADAPMALRVDVVPGPGMRVAEHFPLTTLDPLSWQVEASPEPCTAPRAYPSTCDTEDGYCETSELAVYETDDAACLTDGESALPLLFYRMRADTPPSMPLAVARDGDDVRVTNSSWRGGIGEVWRVRWNGQSGETHATRVPIPDVGGEVRVPMPASGGVGAARAALWSDLGAHGLTTPEADAFMRAWDVALFGATPDGADQPTRASDRRGPAEEVVDLLTVDEIPAIRGGPRIADTILYWLPPDAVEALARIEATPAPRQLRRAILVRADAR